MALSLDPQLAAALAAFGDPPAAPPVGEIAQRRAQGEALIAAGNAQIPMPDDVTVSEHDATSTDGHQVRLRWYVKNGSAPGSAFVYLHGGGYILGHIDLFDGPLGRYVSQSGVPILSVEYRLAPEHPYPAALDDAYAALQWLHDQSSELGVDPLRIGVMGDSAGAGLAACVAIASRDRGTPAVAHQILVMPMLDDRTSTPDPELAGLVSWSYDDNLTAWHALLGDRVGTDDVPPTAAPARLRDASGLPPTYLEVGQLDIFRDEDMQYAITLSRGGVPVEFHLWPGALHEFDGVAPDSDLAKLAVANRVRVMATV